MNSLRVLSLIALLAGVAYAQFDGGDFSSFGQAAGAGDGGGQFDSSSFGGDAGSFPASQGDFSNFQGQGQEFDGQGQAAGGQFDSSSFGGFGGADSAGFDGRSFQ